MTLLGVELGATTVRAVLGAGTEASDIREFPWQPDAPEAVVALLRAAFPRARRVSLAVGLAHLSVQKVTLPPAPAHDRRSMLRLQPDRWFPMATDRAVAVAISPASPLAFACDGTWLTRCIDALVAWQPVVRVEPAPAALLRALAAGGTVTGVASLEGDDANAPAHIVIRDGVLLDVRRTAAPSVRAPRAGDGASVAVATGAALPVREDETTELLTAALETQRTTSRRTRTVSWALATAAAVCACVWAGDHARDRTLAALDLAIAQSRTAAEGGQAKLDRAFALDREAESIAMLRSTRVDQVAALSALSARLPRTAVAQRVRVDGTGWQVDGNATNAAAVLEALAAVPAFDKVRFLAPSSRYQDATGTRETWSIAFDLR